MRFFFIFIGIFLLSNSSTLGNHHPIHVALVSIEYNNETKKFDVLVKMFLDDFEAIIARKYNVILNSGTVSEHKDFSVYATKYVKEHFGIAFNGNTKMINSLVFVKKDLNIEAVWLKYSLQAPSNIKKVKIKTTVMTDIFDDQTNLIFFKYKNFEEAFKLDNFVTENVFSVK